MTSLLECLRVVVEGPLDRVVIRDVAYHVGFKQFEFVGRNANLGKNWILERLVTFNRSARQIPWLIVVDLDRDDCAPDVIRKWLPHPADEMCFRIAVRKIESWLLADQDRLADFLKVPKKLIPIDPDTLPDPKQKMLQLARLSKDRTIREQLVPRSDSGRQVGPGYTSLLTDFVKLEKTGWRVREAVKHSPSLHRCFQALQKLRKQA